MYIQVYVTVYRYMTTYIAVLQTDFIDLIWLLDLSSCATLAHWHCVCLLTYILCTWSCVLCVCVCVCVRNELESQLRVVERDLHQLQQQMAPYAPPPQPIMDHHHQNPYGLSVL